jgi:heptosyltransferase-2
LKKNKKIAVVYSHHKLGDLIWQLPYIKAISEHHNTKITLIVRSKTQAKKILIDNEYIEDFFYCEFRKKLWYFLEIIKLYLFFKKENFSHVYLLDKISRPAISATLAKIPSILGPGINNQKKWITNKFFLNDEDFKKLNYSDQSKKFLELNGVMIKSRIPKLNIKSSRFERIQPEINPKDKIVTFGVDSFERYKMWYEDQFSELGSLLSKKGYADIIYLICSKSNSFVAKNIMQEAKNINFYNCSDLDLLGVIKIIKSSNFYVGNNSGPLNLASALNVKCFGLIANDKVSELQNSNIIPILPDDYKDEFYRDREGMRRLNVSKVYEFIKKEIG